MFALSHLIVSASGMTRLSVYIKREKQIASFAVFDMAKSSASVEKVVTVSCLLALHATAPPNNFMI